MIILPFSIDVMVIQSRSPWIFVEPTTIEFFGMMRSSTAIDSNSRSLTVCPSVTVW